MGKSSNIQEMYQDIQVLEEKLRFKRAQLNQMKIDLWKEKPTEKHYDLFDRPQIGSEVIVWDHEGNARINQVTEMWAFDFYEYGYESWSEIPNR